MIFQATTHLLWSLSLLSKLETAASIPAKTTRQPIPWQPTKVSPSTPVLTHHLALNNTNQSTTS